MIKIFVVFAIFSNCYGSCPFGNKRIEEFLSRRFEASLFTKGLDEETIQRSRPSLKNLYGHCQVEKCFGSLKYRTFSGTCNNIVSNVGFGRRSTLLKRLLEPVYEDGIGQPRSRSISGDSSLPNPRTVSNIVHGSLKSPADRRHTLALMQWGQFLDHDITLTPMFRIADGSLANCTACHSDPRYCHPIPVPENDPYFPSKDPVTKEPKCLEFVRSQSVTFHWREQLNAVTSWIDSSQVYGSFKCHSDHLRQRQGGKLKVLPHPLSPKAFKALLPRHATNHECTSQSELCFNAGDDRANEQPGLTLLHTLLVREHNRLAEGLAYLNPNWNDEKIFEEVRKIIVAINQHITYNEFLPRILGKSLMKLYGLELRENGDYFYDYDNQCDPGIFNEFATAAFRFGHSLIPPGYKLTNPRSLTKKFMNVTHDVLSMRSHINNPDMVMSPRSLDELVESLIFEPMPRYDRGITDEVRNHLMEHSGIKYSGVDLAALNIQRGRDHGLPGYVSYENFCSRDILKRSRESRPKSRITSFDDLGSKFDKRTITKIRQVYSRVEDIDLFSGGMSEKSITDGLVGPTFGCIIANQFEKLRKCDRFWYETPDSRLGFTKSQLKQIRKVNLASLICRNMDRSISMPFKAFDLHHPKTNPNVPCSDHPTIDLKYWATGNFVNSQYCDFDGRLIKPEQEERVSACTSCYCSLRGEAECKTIRPPSCQALVDEVGPEAVISDETCQEACGHLLNNTIACP